MDYYDPDYAYDNWGQAKNSNHDPAEDQTHAEEINEPDANHWSQLERLPF